MSAYVKKMSVQEAGLWRRAAPLLGHLDIELTERCNNNCIHCYINLPENDLKARRRELSTAQVKAILEEAASLGCLRVRFTGGEPLLRDDFEELYVFARRLGLRVQISTNGTLITAGMADLFARIPPGEQILVTVYGMKKSSYEAVTRMPGSFRAAQRGMRFLLEKRVPFAVTGVLLPPTRSEAERFETWAASLPGADGRPAFTFLFDLRCRPNGKKSGLIRRLRLPPAAAAMLLTRGEADALKSTREFCDRFVGVKNKTLFICGAGEGGCVDAYGLLQPCILLRHPDVVYDLKKGSLKDALTSFFPRLRQLRGAHPEFLARCARCFLRGLCEQCPAKSWMEHGSLDKPVQYFCDVAHAQARRLGLLKDNEQGWGVRGWRVRMKEFMGSGQRHIRSGRGRS